LIFPTTLPPEPDPPAIVAIVEAPVAPVLPPIVELPEIDYIRPLDASNEPNTYPRFQCTWWAKEKRPDIPNYLGNANLWFNKLKAIKWPVGYEPRVNAIAQRGMHVAYTERVEGGMVYISERNYDYRGSYRERWAKASDFLYIY
jgi:surface antigen